MPQQPEETIEDTQEMEDESGEELSIHERVADAARTFTQAVLHILGSSTINELDELGRSAELMGAVNCVISRDGRLIGENTDGKGFVDGVRRFADPAGKRMVLFGAGGAARAIAVEMALVGVRQIVIVNRDEGKSRSLADLLNGKVREAAGAAFEATAVGWQGDYVVPEGTDIVVNATSIGLFPNLEARLALDPGSLRPGMVAVEIGNTAKPNSLNTTGSPGPANACASSISSSCEPLPSTISSTLTPDCSASARRRSRPSGSGYRSSVVASSRARHSSTRGDGPHGFSFEPSSASVRPANWRRIAGRSWPGS